MIWVELTASAIYPMLSLLSEPIYPARRENVANISVDGKHLLMEHPYACIDTGPIIERTEA